MKQIIEDRRISYEVVEIEDNVLILQYLKERNRAFKLQRVNHETYEFMKNCVGMPYIQNRGTPIAGFAPLKGDSFRSSGGLKISDSEGIIGGSFIIQDDRIIYTAGEPFFKERDGFVYTNGNTYFTEMTMFDLLKEELQIQRKYLIYMGEKYIKKPFGYEDIFEEVSAEEMLEYATNPEKGQYVLRNRRYF